MSEKGVQEGTEDTPLRCTCVAAYSHHQGLNIQPHLVDFRPGPVSRECQAVVDVSFINIETGRVPFPETVLILAMWDNLGQCVSVCSYMLARKGTGQGWEALVTSRSRGPCTGLPSPTCTHALPLPISPPPSYVPPHLSLWQQKEEGRERAVEGKEERHVADN